MAAWSVGGIRKATTRRRAGPEQNSLARACPRRATRRANAQRGVCFTAVATTAEGGKTDTVSDFLAERVGQKTQNQGGVNLTDICKIGFH